METVSKTLPTETAIFFQSTHIDEIFRDGVVIKEGIPLPLEIELSLADSCTRKCQWCPRSRNDFSLPSDLRFTPYLRDKLSSELKELGYKGLIMLSGYGEPLLHDGISDIVKAFSFTRVNMNTNADLLTRDKVKELVDAGIDKIMISVYEKENEPKFQKMIEGYEDRVILRNRYENLDILFNNRAGGVKMSCSGGNGRNDGATNSGICYYPFYLVMVAANGDCFPCCHEWQKKLRIGNLYQHTFWQVWRSPLLIQVREKILEGNRDIFPCKVCNVNGTYRGWQNFELYTAEKEGKLELSVK